ncbi:Uncharacterised protein [Listeria ivanovii subsp. londoniensis]|uniref:Uncharacterized protein n=1 Tax=Listeria ivanovii TaxID=1638 RepID=A0AAX2DP34_LISIV|nr:hypothetical protein [Listeria ivanovii]MBM5636390.1 hypothetical protein [Listeria ivanovii]MBM5705760.1 hypothetical protein [Listeria ivanovii]SDW64514.1 hypothetical protein SAMN05421782_105135 [Listeria ivanovii]VEH47071.1 Uncharacterised protein [Listeria ivanovii subsp. londoniensis]
MEEEAVSNTIYPLTRKKQRAYSSDGIGIVELTQFLNHYPFGSTMTILTDGKNLDLIILKDS